MAEFFLDTYALVEYVNANKKFIKYFQEHRGITTRLNLMELYYALIKYISEEKAETIYDSFLPLAVELGDDTIKEAMKARLELKQEKRDISYIDAIGYQISKERGAKFLTGDREFRGMKNVEFVK